MNWKKWKLGLVVSALTGALMGVTTLAVVDDVSWEQLLLLLAINAAKDMLLYLKDHPFERVSSKTFLFGILAMVALVVAPGCASINQTLRTELKRPDGIIEVRETHNRAIAVWDAKQTIDRLKISSGKTHSIGLASTEQESGGTNTVAALQAIRDILQLIRPP